MEKHGVWRALRTGFLSQVGGCGGGLPGGRAVHADGRGTIHVKREGEQLLGKGNSICKGLERGCGGGAGRGQVTQGLEGCVGESGLYFGGHCHPWKDSKQGSAWVRLEPEIHCDC